MRLPPKKGDGGSINAVDPRDGESAEVIDLASRSGFSAVAERKGKTEGLGLAAGVAFVGLLGATTFWAMNAAQQTNEPASVGSPTNAPAQAAAAPAVVPAKVAPAAPAQTAPKRPDPAPAPILARAPNAATGVAANPYSSPALIADFSRASGSSTALQGSAPAGTGAAAAAPATGGAVGSAAAFASAIGGVGGGPARAEAMENPKTTLTKGTLIPAILETAINTDVPGYVRAVVSQDVSIRYQ
ncbi:MAG: hypothetical protein SXU28_10190 [Pseudomonadota bacterium]|nr:hypothetical protein [Pseudomonadota bacterium]